MGERPPLSGLAGFPQGEVKRPTRKYDVVAGFGIYRLSTNLEDTEHTNSPTPATASSKEPIVIINDYVLMELNQQRRAQVADNLAALRATTTSGPPPTAATSQA